MPAAPSLLIVPYRSKTGRLYSQIPVPVAPATTGAGDFNVTRDTTATRFDSAGLIASVASGIPRLDYFASGGTVGCPALLVEPSGSNLALQSSDYSLTWISSNLNSTSGITSPSGTNDALLLEATTTTARIRQTVTLTSGTTYTFSWFGKFGSLSSGFTMNVFDENATTYGSGVCQAFNLNEGTLGASGTVGTGFTLQSVGMENYGSGWYRCRMTVLMGYTPATPRVGMRIGTQLSGGRPIAVVSGTVNLWGAQLETGSVATSYIPTTTAAVTRNADVVSVSGAVSGSIGQTEGTIYAEVAYSAIPVTKTIIAITDGTTNNRIAVRLNTPTQISATVVVSSTPYALNQTIPAIPSSGILKIALAYKANDYIFAVNGTTYADTTTRPVPATSAVTLGNNGFNADFFNDRIRAAALYTTRLTNAELAALTTP